MTKRDKRIQWMHSRIAAGHYPNEALLAQKFGISRRQAERDISYMKKTLMAPIVYSSENQGFRYETEFTLPIAVTSGNEDEISGIALRFTDNNENEDVGKKVIQLQIPHTAELIVPDKLAALELRNFVISARPRKNYYVCEFHSVELFLGIIMSLDTDVRILSPKWLRERAVSSAEKIIKANTNIDEQ